MAKDLMRIARQRAREAVKADAKTIAKSACRMKLLEMLSDIETPFSQRIEAAKIDLGLHHTGALCKMFTSAEITEIEREALEIRRGQYTRKMAEVDQALLDRAIGGNVSAAKLCYQRFEGWSEKASVEVGVSVQAVLAAFPEEVRSRIKEAIAKKID